MNEHTPLVAVSGEHAPSTPLPFPAAENPAVAFCLETFRITFNAEIARRTDHIIAFERAGKAYRRTIPALIGYRGVRNFIACVAHGVVIGVITPKESAALLHAARIASVSFPAPNPGKSSEQSLQIVAKPEAKKAK